MKKKKNKLSLNCRVGHLSFFVGYEDLIIKDDKIFCEKCGKEIKRGKIKKYIKVIKSLLKNENQNYVQVTDYEGWSYHNTCFQNQPLWDVSTKHLISKSRINEVEYYGLYKLLEEELKKWTDVDIDCYIYKSKFDGNCIRPKYSDYDFDLRCLPNAINVTKNSKEFKQYESISGNIITEDSEIITVTFVTVKRYNKSKFWRIANKRKCNIHFFKDFGWVGSCWGKFYN